MKTQTLVLTGAVLLPAAFPAFAATHYVDANSTNALPPYANWATAANVFQDAVDAADSGDIVLVTNGVYATGGKAVVGLMTNRVLVDKPLTLLSVNGPEFTIIQGYQMPGTTNGDGAIRCVYLTNGAFLGGFTLTSGATRIFGDSRELGGGGLWCESTNASASNCIVVGNSASSFAGGTYGGTINNCIISSNRAYAIGRGYGGGSYLSLLNNCTITGNLAFDSGGGAARCTMYNCVLTANSAGTGGASFICELNSCMLNGNSATAVGGASFGTLNNCIIVGNMATLFAGGSYGSTLNNCTLTGNSANNAGGVSQGSINNCVLYSNVALVVNDNWTASTINYSCTTPLPTSGVGNLDTPPSFIDAASNNFRLQSNSPCINAGNNAYVTKTTDLNDNPRIAGGTVDMGAYEFQSPQSAISYAWLQ